MKEQILPTLMLSLIIAMTGCAGKNNDPSTWSKEKTDQWFDAGKWLNGWNVKPDATIDRKALAAAYFKNRERWDKAFGFLSSHDLQELEPGRHDIDGDDLYAMVSEYTTVGENEKHFEAHRKYIDIQYVIEGREKIDISPLADTVRTIQPYDPQKDIGFYEIRPVQGYTATPASFFIFFPSDAHKPGIKAGEAGNVKKLVIKLKTD